MYVLILGLLLFLGVHSVRIAAPAWRDARLSAMGEGAWKGAYSVVSFVGLALIVWGYGLAWQDNVFLYAPPVWTKHVAALLMLLALISFSVYAMPAGRLKPALKHPMLLSVKIWAVAHLLANGDLTSVLLFGSFLAWAVADRISVKRRATTGITPGPVTWDIGALVLGVALYALFVWRLHEWLFGVAPFA